MKHTITRLQINYVTFVVSFYNFKLFQQLNNTKGALFFTDSIIGENDVVHNYTGEWPTF